MIPPTFNRLETRARTEDFSRALRAEVRDPLWMLSRQWQMGEFRAENTGSAIKSRVHASIHPVQQFLTNKTGNVHTITHKQPLEVFVEREKVPMDLLMRMEMGRHFIRLLRKGISDETVQNQMLEHLGNVSTPISLKLSLPAQNAGSRNLFSDRKLRQAAAMFAAGNSLDGGMLYDYLQADPAHKLTDFFAQLPQAIAANAVDEVGNSFVTWFERTYSQPADSSEKSYQDQRGEYEFYVSTPMESIVNPISGGGQTPTPPGAGGQGSVPQPLVGSVTALHAPQYHHGKLDWYAFNIANGQDGLPADFTVGDASKIKDITRTMVPVATRFAGMPHSRWWQFEDGKVNLQAPRGGELNPAEVVFNDFAMLFSNDWMVFPFTVPFGHLCEIDSVVVTDVFGQRSKVMPAGSDDSDDYLRWDLFSLKQEGGVRGDYRLFLPPVLDRIQEGKPFEEVHLVRDEMANMVWAIEKTIGDGMGKGRDGYEAAEASRKYLERLLPEAQATASDIPGKKYTLATKVPDNWIPFIPVKVGENNREVQLQRSSMPREVAGQIVGRILPRTGIVSQPASPFYLNEEEVPRAGAMLTRTWQRTRWYNGKTFNWVGRRKQTGRGEAASGLAFDTLGD